MNTSLIVVLVLFVAACAGGSGCEATLKAAGVSDRFPGVVAHGIHSMTVDTLHLFKPSSTSDNGIPTINSNLLDGKPILHDAPEAEVSMFSTNAMRAADRVFMHMSDKYYDLKQYSPLEKLVHALHMEEIWHEAALQYANISLNPPSKALCECVSDVESNGVMKMLRFIALTIREPELMYGKKITINGKEYSWSGNLYRYSFYSTAQEADTFLKPEDVIPSLLSTADWVQWKQLMMSLMVPSDDYELALYLYCTLNQ